MQFLYVHKTDEKPVLPLLQVQCNLAFSELSVEGISAQVYLITQMLSGGDAVLGVCSLTH